LSRVLVILNPAAGRGRALRSWPGLSRALLVEADGEIVFEDAYRLEIEVLPGALSVLG
jgi:diacylglycerol kinase family enzyme